MASRRIEGKGLGKAILSQLVLDALQAVKMDGAGMKEIPDKEGK